jgi:peptide/nickel transport system substrate-binding protein
MWNKGSNYRKFVLVSSLLMGVAFVPGAAFAQSTITAVVDGDLRILDPYRGTGSSAHHAQMIYDTLFSIDAEGNAQPQMVQDFTVNDDATEFTLTLRDGLAFSDGSPVTAEDVVASGKRWAVLTSTGRSVPMDPETAFAAVDEQTITITLDSSFPLLPDALGSGFAPLYIMRAADLDGLSDEENVTTAIGSGPFLFAEDEWAPGSETVYLKNDDYLPRSEPASGYAGGHEVLVDRVVWLNIVDSQTALSALETGEVDMLETVESTDLVTARETENVEVAGSADRGQTHMVVLNHKAPPFDTPEGRQAMLELINPHEVLLGAAGSDDLFEVCGSWYICGSRYAKDAGAAGLDDTPDFERAQELLEEAGYNGEPIVMLMASDRTAYYNGSQVVAYQLSQLDTLNVEPQNMDWGSLTTRRASMELPSEGGWSIFYTTGSTASQSNPLFHFNGRTSCEDAWFGWPCDMELEEKRVGWGALPDEEARSAAAQEIQEGWAEVLPFIPFGKIENKSAYRADQIDGVLDVPLRTPFWNIAVIE